MGPVAAPGPSKLGPLDTTERGVIGTMRTGRPATRRIAAGMVAVPLLAWLLVAPGPAGAAGQAAERADAIRATIAAILADSRIQTRLPDLSPAPATPAEPAPKAQGPSILDAVLIALRRAIRWLFNLPHLLMLGLSVLLLGVLGLAVFKIGGRFGRRGAPAEPLPPTDVVAQDRPGRPPALDQADRLAGEGAFGEALHLLLLYGLAALGPRSVPAFSPALTSREIARQARLAEDRRQALLALIGRVERAWFGGRPAGDADYQAGRRELVLLLEQPDGRL